MPTLNTITLTQLVEQIKKEGRIKGSDNLDQFIKDTINELLLDFAGKIRYHELLLLNQPITLVDEQGIYALPAAFQTLHLVHYKVEQGTFYTIHKRPTYVENTSGGRPRYYDLAGANISLFPFDQVCDSDTLELDYYKYPTQLTADADVFPIPKLITPVKKQAIYRALVYNKELQSAVAFSASANESEVRSRRAQTDG